MFRTSSDHFYLISSNLDKETSKMCEKPGEVAKMKGGECSPPLHRDQGPAKNVIIETTPPQLCHISVLDSDYGNMVQVDGNVHVINSFLDKVGMGRYQWQLWVLCGFGWVADQMLLQMLAIIQPRLQAEFDIDGYKVGGITSSYFAGLATGA